MTKSGRTVAQRRRRLRRLAGDFLGLLMLVALCAALYVALGAFLNL